MAATKRATSKKKGREEIELTDDDERALSAAWAKVAKQIDAQKAKEAKAQKAKKPAAKK